MNLARRTDILIKNAALRAGLGVGVLSIALGGVGFLIAAFFLWLRVHLGDAPAAAITGGVLLAMALLTGLVGSAILRRVRRRQPSLMAELGGTFGLAIRVIVVLVRRDPKKAMVISVLVGAVAEYLFGEKKR